MKNSTLFAIVVVIMTFLTAVTFVASHLFFANEPDIENIFSIVWTIAFGVVLYRLMRYIAPTKNAAREAWRRDFYGGLIFLCELLAVVTLIITAIIFSNMLTSGETIQTPILLSMGLIALCALAVPVGTRIIRSLNQRLARAEGRSDG